MAWDQGKPEAGIAAKLLDNRVRDNNAALETAANREHEFSTGGTVADQLHHRKGSARCFIQDAIPTTRVDGTAFTAEDNGSLWIDTNSTINNQFNILTDYSGPTWTPISTEIIAVAVAAIHTWAAIQTFSEAPVFTKGVVANDSYLVGRNNADDGNIDLIKVNTSDEAELGVALNAPTLTSPVINTGVSGTAIDTDGTLAANSDTLLPSQKAVKTAIDANLGLQASTGSDTTPYGDSVLDGGTDPMGVNTWTDLDLDAQASIGTQKTLVVLKVINNTGGARALKFRPNGTTEEVGDESTWANSSGIGTLYLTPGECGFIMLMTDSSGIVEHKCKTPGGDIDIFLMAYIK